MKHLAAAAALAALALAAPGCGSSTAASDAAQPTKTASATPTPTPTETPTLTETPSPTESDTPALVADTGQYSVRSTRFTDPDGWQYQFSPTFDAPTFSFTKDISTSPPGKAKLAFSMTLPDDFGWQMLPATGDRTPPPGKPDSVIVFFPYHFGKAGYQISDLSSECYFKDWYNFIGSFDQSPAKLRAAAKALGIPVTSGLFCDVQAGGALAPDPNTVSSFDFSAASQDTSESAVDQFVAAMQNVKPVIVAAFENWNCLAFYVPTNDINFSTRGDCKIGPF